MSIEFQIYDWLEDHELEKEDDSSEENDSESNGNHYYIIHTFGRTLEGKSVYMKIVNFTPYFYIKLPERWIKSIAKANVKKMFSYFTSDFNKKVWSKFRPYLINMDVVERMSPEGFTNGKKFLFARLIFNNSIAMKKFRFLFEQSKIYIPGITKKPYQFKTYEANLPPMLRCFHSMKVRGCSWVEVEKYEKIEEESEKESYCDIELRVDWRKVKPIEKDQNAPLRILSFDIECNSIDGEFPQAKRAGDAVIQIGSTYTYLGESLPYRQHIVCLEETAKVEGAIVEWYDNERDLVKAWIKEVIKNDCDIITGYNIFYFDESYIHDRCEEHLNLMFEISRFSKLKNHDCRYRDFTLASSALGENRIKMFDTPGRIHIDLMKDVQKTYKLNSYRLDAVSSNFIRDKITKIVPCKNNVYELHCKGIDDIFNNDFIHIELVLDYVSDEIGYKYKIFEIDEKNNILKIKGDEDLEKYIEDPKPGTLWWSQAKDDVGPKDIFRLQKGSPEDRAVVAKYCIKDCRLVNLLMNKLQVVTKNIEMANVCYVPLSFLFTRGQGIKLFSFCLKVYREEGYIYPVLKKPEEKTPSYEGAIVFDPEPSVDYEAQAVKDYASLYPSSMIQKNMSDETIVLNDKYDNLPGVEYYNSKFREYDGSIKYRRFAKVNGELGIIPKILQALLNERKKVKKQMKVEKDDFKKEILDAKQLALKVTANSLYGSKGADTSQVRQRDIAACTTSTGREMLIFAKKYDEEIIPGLLNGLQLAFTNNDEEKLNMILDTELKDKSLIPKLKKYLCEDIIKYTFQPIIRYGDTDSIFSCYRFREDTKKVGKKTSLTLLKEIVKFSEKLITPFIPIEYQCLWEELHQEYYSTNLITDLQLPMCPDVLPQPEHHKTILPIKERFKQFLKEYMEESFFPWLWTLQDMYQKKYRTDKLFKEILNVKLFRMGNDQVEKIRLVPEDFDGETKAGLSSMIKSFIDNTLKDNIIQPIWDFDNKKNKIIKIMFRKGGKMITDKRSLKLSIDMGIFTGELVKSQLPFPHDLEYEKTFWPFLILTKKRYVGNKYEFDPTKYKQDYNGIVLKRRDNAPIVKEICGGIINCLINDKDPNKAERYTNECLDKMFNGKYDIKYFLTSKTLKMKESYVDWTRIAHVVLADRISVRDPGNCPQSGDRIPFAFIKIKNVTKDTLQGDRIETPDYIKEKNLKLDYGLYMTNQIMKPSLQFLDLALPNAQDIFENWKIKIENEQMGRTDIKQFIVKN